MDGSHTSLNAVAILAGGLATRMRPLTETVPKSMLDVNGEPFIAHQLRLLRRYAITDAVLCIGHLGDQIVDYVGDGSAFEMRVRYSVDASRPMGTAGALKAALGVLPETFFVVYGDSYLDCDYQAVWRAFAEAPDALALMTVYRNAGLYDSSNVEYADGRIVAYSKTDTTERMTYIDYGLGIFRRGAFDHVPDDQSYDLATLYGHILAAGRLSAAEITTRFYEIGSMQGLEETRALLRIQGGTRV